jgi:UDP-glucose 4-epimerase
VPTPDLVRALAQARGVKARVWPFPLAALNLIAAIAGRRSELARLTGLLQVNSSRIRRELDWEPRYSLTQGLTETARWYRGGSGRP